MKLSQIVSTSIWKVLTLTTLAISGINVAMAADALFVDAGGNVGIGTGTPSVPLHVQRNDGTSLLRVEETNGTTSARSMFELINNGPIGFNMSDTSTGNNWRFAAQTTGFRISLAGTGGPEFEVLDNGNAVLAGTLTENSDINVKKDIETLDGEYVLAQLEQVPVSEWTYKKDEDARHIGPMAQDFHKAFGLGNDETHISPRDMAGVNMAAIKAQQEYIRNLQDEIAQLRQLVEQLANHQGQQVASAE